MKNLFDRESVHENPLPPTHRPDPVGQDERRQMLAHCSATIDMAVGRLNVSRVWIKHLDHHLRQFGA